MLVVLGLRSPTRRRCFFASTRAILASACARSRDGDGASAAKLCTNGSGPARARALTASTRTRTRQLQTHYDNPAGAAGRVDNSAIRVYYTAPRAIDIGVMQATPLLAPLSP